VRVIRRYPRAAHDLPARSLKGLLRVVSLAPGRLALAERLAPRLEGLAVLLMATFQNASQKKGLLREKSHKKNNQQLLEAGANLETLYSISLSSFNVEIVSHGDFRYALAYEQ
jgi:hypothetical protein